MRRIGSILTGLTALAFFAAAALHATGYGWIVAQANLMTDEAALVVPPLWLMFSADLAIIGLILLIVAVRPGRASPLIVLVAALAPLVSGGLLARGIRFGGPVPILVALAGLALLSAGVLAIEVRLGGRRPLPQPDAEGTIE